MKITKLIMAALVAGSLFAGGSALQAQDSTNAPAATPPAGMRQRGLNFDTIAKQLELTDDQKTKIKPIVDDLTQKLRALRQDPSFASLSPEDKRAKMKDLRDAATAQVKDILTPDQLTKWSKLIAGGRRGGAGAPPAATPPPATN